jgi:hypothetical protein
MKKLILSCLLLASMSMASAESVQTTASFRSMMKREYNVTVPPTLVANAKSAEMCYGLDVSPCNKLGDICEKSNSKGCRAFIRKLQAIAAEEYN